jgi:Tol biopolymer transport system component
VLSPSAAAGSYVPPPGDWAPAWSPDGTYVSFVTTRGGLALADVKPDGTAEQRLLAGDFRSQALSPDWKKIAWIDGNELFVKIVATDQVRKLAEAVDSFVWAPDSQRVAALSRGVLAVVGLDGDLGPPLAQGASQPAWAPSGDRIAVAEAAGGTDLDVHVVKLAGGDVNLTPGDRRSNLQSRTGRSHGSRAARSSPSAARAASSGST